MLKDSTREALVKSINQNPHESVHHWVFADFLQENGVPGAEVVRSHARHTDSGLGGNALGRLHQLVGTTRYQNGDLVSVDDSGNTHTGSKALSHAWTTGSPLFQAHVGKRGMGVAVSVRYGTPSTGAAGDVDAVGHARTADELRALLDDVPTEARTRLLQSLHERGHLQRALVGKGSRSFKLARPVRLAAIQPPTGGQPTVTVRVPVPQPVPSKPAAPPAPAPAKKPSGTAFILPG